MKRISDLAPLAIAIVIIAITVAMGATVLSNMDDEVYDAKTVANETFNATAKLYNVTVAEASTDNFHQLTSAQGYNTTAQSTEVTTSLKDAENGIVQVEFGSDPTNWTSSLEYDYEDENTATTTIGDGISALSDFSGWFSIIVLVVIAAIIIGIVVTSFGGTGRGI